MLIGQDIGTNYLVPIALDHLMKDPWVAGDFFEGDLLLNVLRLDSNYWVDHQDQLLQLTEIMDVLVHKMNFFEKELSPLWEKITQWCKFVGFAGYKFSNVITYNPVFHK